MINWKKDGIATSIVAHLFTGMILIFGLWMYFVMNVIPKSPEFFIVLLFILLILSTSLLVYSKIPNILSGNYFSFGPGNIIEERRGHYKTSYLLLVISIALAVSLKIAVDLEYSFLINK